MMRFPWLSLAFESDTVEDLFEKLDDTRMTLLAIGQSAIAESAFDRGDLLRMLAIPANGANERELARARIPRPSFYLLRPDGHVGLCGPRADPSVIARYLSERLRLTEPARPSHR